MSIPVETYSGFRVHERPRRFFWREKWLQVEKVLARWQTPDYLVFKVAADDGCTYRLRYHRVDDAWEVSPG
jgi:hypothetical protein